MGAGGGKSGASDIEEGEGVVEFGGPFDEDDTRRGNGQKDE